MVTATKTSKKEEGKTTTKRTGKYLYAIGRRKSSVARVRVYKKGTGIVEVNGKKMEDYFGRKDLQSLIRKPLTQVGISDTADVTVRVLGGGDRGQADSISLGISRALIKGDEDLRKSLKPLGLLTRDPRVKERKKYGLKRARRAPQWAKR
jgi:small subunit ribosomal protein S9